MTPRSKRVLWAASALCCVLLGSPVNAAPTEPSTLANPLVKAQECEMCHSFDNAVEHQADPLYAPYYTWRGTMMANASRDPVFWAGVAIADQDAPGETTDCVRCHAPRAFLEGRGDATTIDALTTDDLDGSVECELCHRMVDDPQTEPGNARYTIDDTVMGNEVPRRGPWTYGAGDDPPPHAWAQDPFVGSSELCGTCHDVTTPAERVDDRGQGLGVPFNEQRTYSEWLGSAYAVPGDDFQACQDCHMPAVADMPGCRDYVDASSHPTGGRRHDLAGANVQMLEVLKSVYGNGGTSEVDDFFWDLTIGHTKDLLKTAATVEVDAPDSVDLAAGLSELAVTVTNETGHKLPTGYSEGRVMWIQVVATYNDDVVFASGQWNEASGIEPDENLHTYQAIAEDYADGTTFHLLRNNHWVEDTRIPPRGSQPDLETDPVGDRYTLQNDGTWPHFDTATYDFAGRDDVVDDTPDDTTDDTLEVTVRLCYQINTPDYIQFLADENQTNQAGNYAAMLFDTTEIEDPCTLFGDPISASIPITNFGLATSTSTGPTEDTTTATTNATTTADSTGTGTTDTDPGQDDTSDGGCNCTTRPTASTPIWLTLLLLGLRRKFVRKTR